MPAKTKVFRSTIENLSSKLDKLEDVLTEDERAIFIAVFSLSGKAFAPTTELGTAGINIQPSSEICVEIAEGAMVPPLSKAFEESFRPGGSRLIDIRAIEIEASIGAGATLKSW